MRWWRSESRKTLVSDIEKVIEKAIGALTTYKDTPEYVELIVNLMADGRVSIDSLTTTYRDDPDMIGEIRVILTNIDLQLKKYPHLIKGNTDGSNDVEILSDDLFSAGLDRPKRGERNDRGDQREKRKRRHKKSVAESSESEVV